VVNHKGEQFAERVAADLDRFAGLSTELRTGHATEGVWVTGLRDTLTDAVHAAFTQAAHHTTAFTAAEGNGGGVHERSAVARRRRFAEYLQVAREAWTPGVVISPAWVRRVSGCSRGLSGQLATALAGELDGESGGVVRP
jgi:hypothetical protein